MEAIALETRAAEATSTEMPSVQRVLEFVRAVIGDEKLREQSERRAHLRYPITLPVRAVPLNDDKKPVAGPFYAVTRDICIAGSFMALTRDISAGGVSLYHTQPIKEKFVQLELAAPDGEQLRVTLQVRRCRKAGPFYEIAGRFTEDA